MTRMPNKVKKRIGSLLLVLVLLLGMIPWDTMPANADTREEINFVQSSMSESYIPQAGNPVTVMPSGYMKAISGMPYDVEKTIGIWHDEQGTEINTGQIGSGYCFEGGKSYYIDVTYKITNSAYKFADTMYMAYINGEDAQSYEYSVVSREEDGSAVTIRYTFTIPGGPNPQIEQIVLLGNGRVAAGYDYTVEMPYHNCTMKEYRWSGNFDSNHKFMEGQNYTLQVVLDAKTGYLFSEAVNVVLDDFTPSNTEVSNGGSTLTITYEFSLGAKQAIRVINQTLPWYVVLSPLHGKAASGVNPSWLGISDNGPYEKVLPAEGNYVWYNENNEPLTTDLTFQAGYEYHFSVDYVVKDSYVDTHQFNNVVAVNIAGESFMSKGYLRAEQTFIDSQRITVTYYFTAEFGADAGKTPDTAVRCINYKSFKKAMENSDIRYVTLGSVTETLPKIEKDGGGLVSAIEVAGIKYLNIDGNASFTAPSADPEKYDTYVALLHTDVGAELNISGKGNLTFRAVASESYNAVVYNQGGNVNISSGSLTGTYNTAVYGRAIWQSAGDLHITGGNFQGINALQYDKTNSVYSPAVWCGGGNVIIEGGIFNGMNEGHGNAKCYGLGIGDNASVALKGGNYVGIMLPTDITPLSDYVDKNVYTVLVNEQWIDPDSQYSQEYVESGITRIVRRIKEVNIGFDAPVAEQPLDMSIWIGGEGYSMLEQPRWYRDGELVENPTMSTYVAGSVYTVKVTLQVDSLNFFEFDSEVVARVNSNEALISYVEDYDGKVRIEVTYEFPSCPSGITSVEFSGFNVPKEHETPDYSGVSDDTTKYWILNNGNPEYVCWYENGQLMGSEDTFEVGNNYAVSFWTKATNGYEFACDENWEPVVSASVNGTVATVRRAYEQEPEKVVEIYFDFGMLNDSVIDTVEITGIVEPYAGASPSYKAVSFGNGYGLETGEGRDYWEGTLYKANGVVWYDEDWNLLYETDKFVAGKIYHVLIHLDVTDTENYQFNYNSKTDDETKVTGTINGNAATVKAETSNGMWNHTIEAEFTCKKQEISFVGVSGLDAPVHGANPDYEAILRDPDFYGLDENYGIGGIYWYRPDGSVMLENETFVGGYNYQLEIKLIPTQLEGADVSVFNHDLKAVVNNNEASQIYAMSNKAYLYTSYYCDFSADGIELSGNVVSYGDENASATVELVYKESGLVADSKQITGNTGMYTFTNVLDGNYILRVSKAGHVTREYEVTAAGTNLVRDAAIWLLGDVNGDGYIDATDATQIERKFNGKASIFDTGDEDTMNYRLKVANVYSADEIIDSTDAMQIKRMYNGKSSVYD